MLFRSRTESADQERAELAVLERYLPAAMGEDEIRAVVAEEVAAAAAGGATGPKAMGGVVTRNRVKEIGWGEVDVVPGSDAGQWFGAHRRLQVFQWHGETFSIPPGATRVLTGDLCPNQGFALGPHLALQCHIEVTAEIVRAWCRGGADEIATSPGPGVQTRECILDCLEQRIALLNATAGAIYDRWAVRLSA